MFNQEQGDALSAQDYWNISHAVTRLFAEAPDERPPTDRTLRLPTTRLGWDVGGFWIVNELRMVLECAAFYSPTPDSFKNFETVSRARHFTFGEGLPGSTWKARSVVCFPDVSKEENFPRLSLIRVHKLWISISGFESLGGSQISSATSHFFDALVSTENSESHHLGSTTASDGSPYDATYNCPLLGSTVRA